jgi:hypothetical protein
VQLGADDRVAEPLDQGAQMFVASWHGAETPR